LNTTIEDQIKFVVPMVRTSCVVKTKIEVFKTITELIIWSYS